MSAAAAGLPAEHGRPAGGTVPDFAWTRPSRSRVHSVTVGAQGRLVIPAEVREALGLEPGQPLSLQIRDGGLFFIDPREAARRLRGSVPSSAEGTSLSDELLEDRRTEVAREEAEE